MNAPDDPVPTPEQEERLLARLREQLDAACAASTRSVAEAVLRRIGLRTPQELTATFQARTLRRLSAAAAAVLAGLWLFSPGAREPEAEVQPAAAVLPWLAPDEDEPTRADERQLLAEVILGELNR